MLRLRIYLLFEPLCQGVVFSLKLHVAWREAKPFLVKLNFYKIAARRCLHQAIGRKLLGLNMGVEICCSETAKFASRKDRAIQRFD